MVSEAKVWRAARISTRLISPVCAARAAGSLGTAASNWRHVGVLTGGGDGAVGGAVGTRMVKGGSGGGVLADAGVVAVVDVGASEEGGEGGAGDVEGVRSTKKSMNSGELAATSGDDGSEEEAETGGEGTERVWTRPGERWEEEGAKRDERECDTGNADEGTEVIEADEEDDDDDECREGAGGLVADDEVGAEGNEVVGGAAGRSLV